MDNSSIISISYYDLTIVFALIVILAFVSLLLKLKFEKKILIAASRTIIQLLIIGHLLKFIFQTTDPYLITCIIFIMVLMAGREIYARQEKKKNIRHGQRQIFVIGTIAVIFSSFSMTMIGLSIISPAPWYSPQYLIPIMGMISGNTINGISIAIDRILSSNKTQREIIENRLMLGETPSEATSEIKKEAIKSALMPIMNMMSIVGIVSLPGMMTGQILGGTAPEEAVKYQIFIMFLIATGTCLGTIISVHFSTKLLFDDQMRLHNTTVI